MSTTFEKYAQELALAATTGERAPLVRVAQPFTKAANVDLAALLKDPTVQRYLLGGLGGAGLGALIGSMQPQKKKRNALMYGLMGGAGGLGLAHLLGSGLGAPTAENTDKPIAAQSAAETIAAARAAGMSPQEYVRQQGAQAENSTFRGALLADGGPADRIGGAAAASAAVRAGRAGAGYAARKAGIPQKTFKDTIADVRAQRRSSLDAAAAVRTKTVRDRGTPLLTGGMAKLDPAQQEYSARRQAILNQSKKRLHAAAPMTRLPSKIDVPTGGFFNGPKLTTTPVSLGKARSVFGRALQIAPAAYGAVRGLSGASQDASNVVTGAGNVLDYVYGGGGSK